MFKVGGLSKIRCNSGEIGLEALLFDSSRLPTAVNLEHKPELLFKVDFILV